MAHAHETPSTESGPGTPGRVLLVDDQPELRRLFKRSLTRAGYEVVEACDGRSAIEHALREHFDVVISDVRMPDMSGVELLRELAEFEPDLPVVLTSGALEQEVEAMAMEYGALAYLMKPVSLERMHAAAALAVELRRDRAQAKAEFEPCASMKRLRIKNPRDLRKTSER